MICPKCKAQWAEFEPEDFDFIEGFGFIPTNPTAEERREKVWAPNEEKICPDCEEAMKAESQARMLSETIYSIWGPRLLGAIGE